MKIAPRSPAARTTASVRASASARPSAAQPAATATAASAPPPTTSLMGIPAEEMTPKVRTAIELLMREVERLRSETEDLRRKNASLEKVADEDALLPISNRRAFVRELSRAMSFASRYSQPSSLGFFDVNNMKSINDSHGHAAGDAALMHVAESLLRHVRQSDVIGRLGGDEFGVILNQMDEAAAVSKVAELAEKIRLERVAWEGGDIEVSIAYGVHTFDGGGEPADALAAADKAMYVQKTSREVDAD